MNCPVCKDQVLSVTERQGVEIDVCPRCRGVWLDRGELDKIIERASAYDRDDDRDRGRDEDYRSRSHGRGESHYDPRYHKRKSFWSELFD